MWKYTFRGLAIDHSGSQPFNNIVVIIRVHKNVLLYIYTYVLVMVHVQHYTDGGKQTIIFNDVYCSNVAGYRDGTD